MAAYSRKAGLGQIFGQASSDKSGYKDIFKRVFSNPEAARSLLEHEAPSYLLDELDLDRIEAVCADSLRDDLVLSGDGLLLKIPTKNNAYGSVLLMVEIKAGLTLSLSMQFTSRELAILIQLKKAHAAAMAGGTIAEA